ncbi:MAG: type II toxin-antitoxin system RelB/DinJ family antitoxin [Lachnospiraceae bacterium]|nr:type II toxin-antitoxin system RelB/DinJ family antitoxin [Lachnospiraceae bacterium]
MIETLSVATAPKTSTFQMRINPEIKKNVEDIYARAGMTLTDAVNIFLQQTINVQGLPLIATADSKTAMKEQAKVLLMMELEKGLKSAKEEGWISEEEMCKEFGDTL